MNGLQETCTSHLELPLISWKCTLMFSLLMCHFLSIWSSPGGHSAVTKRKLAKGDHRSTSYYNNGNIVEKIDKQTPISEAYSSKKKVRAQLFKGRIMLSNG